MSVESAELLALALALEAEEVPGEEAVQALLTAADHSPTALMGAHAYALGLARDMPLDARTEETIDLLTEALQRAVRHGADRPSTDAPSLVEHIVEASGEAPLAPGAVARRAAEIQDDLARLRSGPASEAADNPSDDSA